MPTRMRMTRMRVQQKTRPQHRARPPRVRAPACSSLRNMRRPSFFGIEPSAASCGRATRGVSRAGLCNHPNNIPKAHLGGNAPSRDGDLLLCRAKRAGILVEVCVAGLGRVGLPAAGNAVAVPAGRDKVGARVLVVRGKVAAGRGVGRSGRGLGRVRVARVEVVGRVVAVAGLLVVALVAVAVLHGRV